MTTDTIHGTLEREDTHTNSELKLTDVQAEMDRQNEQIPTPAELAAMERQLKDGIAEFRAEIDAVRRSGILGLHMPDGPEARRRRGLLAPLAAPQPGPYHELAPANLDAEHEAAKQVRRQRKAIGWTPNVPEGAGPTFILGAVELSEDDKAEKVRQVRAAFQRIGAEPEPDGWVDPTRLRRLLAWIGSRRKRGL